MERQENKISNVVDTSEGRNIDGLAADSSGTTNAGGVLAGSGIDDGADQNLDGVLVTKNEQTHSYIRRNWR